MEHGKNAPRVMSAAGSRCAKRRPSILRDNGGDYVRELWSRDRVILAGADVLSEREIRLWAGGVEGCRWCQGLMSGTYTTFLRSIPLGNDETL